jgi:hypothetical protein
MTTRDIQRHLRALYEVTVSGSKSRRPRSLRAHREPESHHCRAVLQEAFRLRSCPD